MKIKIKIKICVKVSELVVRLNGAHLIIQDLIGLYVTYFNGRIVWHLVTNKYMYALDTC